MELLRPAKIKHKIKQNIYVHKDLMTYSHLFVRINRVKKGLEPAFGTFSVKFRTEKYFTIVIKHKDVKISADRLKPAYMWRTLPVKTTYQLICFRQNQVAGSLCRGNLGTGEGAMRAFSLISVFF